MVDVAAQEGGPELVSFRELARRLVEDGVLPAISHQRVSQLSREDPHFPPVVTIGRSKAVDWRVAEPYFRERKGGQGRRTDLEMKREQSEREDRDPALGEDASGHGRPRGD